MNDGVFARAAQIVEQLWGWRFAAERRRALEDGLGAAAGELRLTPMALLAGLAGNPSEDLLRAVVRQLSIGETYFFRHPEYFAVLQDRILPELMRARQDTRQLRAWSAGCATGEEAYSLAMALGSGAGSAWSVRVLGTDVNMDALRIAERGRYPRSSLRGSLQQGPAGSASVPAPASGLLPPAGAGGSLSGWMKQLSDGGVEATPELRERVHFRYLNLHDPIYPSIFTHTQGMDLIFCRNVLVYFTPEAAVATLQRLRDCLVEGGYLAVGALDVDLAPAGLKPVVWTGLTVLRRTSSATARAALPPPPRRPSARPRAPVAVRPPASQGTDSGQAAQLLAAAKQAADRGDVLAAQALARQALACERSPLALHLLALIVGECGDLAERSTLLREATARAPGYVQAHLGLGLSERSEAPADRASHLRRVLELVAARRDDELLPGPDPLPVLWVKKTSLAALRKLEPHTRSHSHSHSHGEHK